MESVAIFCRDVFFGRNCTPMRKSAATPATDHSVCHLILPLIGRRNAANSTAIGGAG